MSFSVNFATSEAFLHYDATFGLEQGKVGVNSTDKLECNYVVDKLGCGYVVDDVSGESFYQNWPKAKRVIDSLPMVRLKNG